MIRILSVSLVLSVLAMPASAQEAEQPEVKNPYVAAVDAFREGLTPEQDRHFSVMTGNYNIIQIVKGVKESLGNAVDACGDANPDMEERMENRYDVWVEAVDPIIEEAEANVDNMVLVQDYGEKREIRKIFKLLRQTREAADDALEKVPVTAKEGCNYALNNMDQTQVSFSKLLRQTLISLPQMIQEEDAKKREKQKAAETPDA